jgi:tetratricopeptide (TPR) repeat protein
VYRKLGEIYLRREELGRADEAIEQAEEYLRSGQSDSGERGEIYLVLGQLYMARNDYNNAVIVFEKAQRAFERSNQHEGAAQAKRALVKAYKMLGQADKAMELLRELGEANASMWRSLLNELNPLVAQSAHSAFYSGEYVGAIQAGFRAVELRARELTGKRGEDLSKVLSSYLETRGRGVSDPAEEKMLLRFREFAVAAFELFHNRTKHGPVDPTAPEAFSELCVASLIASMLESPLGSGEKTNSETAGDS